MTESVEVFRHGTPGAYKRHQRAGEKPCEVCARSHREAQRKRDQAGRPALAVVPAPDDGVAPIDRLARARWALAATEAAIAAGRPGLSGLIREHSRLVDMITVIEEQQREERETRPLPQDSPWDADAI